jgi:pimeloyl-ACP methyl ester carboxylesterase/DNA-binding winged helix-turn-helix (wHTH) protein/class 3 adenylate cyclase
MIGVTARKYSFCGFRLDADERLLFDHDNSIQLPPKVFDTLVMLVENSGKVLSKERMLEEIWQGSFVEENNLAQNISALRRVLREGRDTKYIETVPKTGYRFVADVEETGDVETDVIEKTRARFFVEDEDEALGRIPIDLMNIAQTAALAKFEPETHYVQNGDVNIAYQVVGSGDIDIVFVMGWVSHLEYFWKHHLFASFLNRLASFSRLILFDKRGTGLSDHVPINELPTLEQRMEDVHAVMDAVESERAVLIGVSEGGPMCSLFAATYPERTAALVMIGTYAKRIRDENYPWAPTEAERDAFFEVMQNEWGGPVGIEERAPSLSDDKEFRDWWATYLRMGASPGAALALTKMNAEIDVREVLPSVRVPTLVIHRSGDLCLPAEGGRFVASKISGAKYVELSGVDHLPFVGNQEEILDEIEEFVTSVRCPDEHDRVLATVMNIKIIDAADEEARRGRESWIKLFENSHEYVQRELALFKGKQVSYDETGVLAVFDGPARAIRCASAITDSAGRMGVRVKTGLHTGECDVIDGMYSGFAVELAKKIAEESGFGNILVSRTVKDLVAGSGISFEVFGPRLFPNIGGQWPIFKVIR